MTVTGDEIAVVGLAGRFPAAPDVAALWRNLLDGVDAVHDHTDAELRALGLTERLIADPALVRAAARLAGVADFDAAFFGVPQAEAARMDPQHRLFLEQAYVALADAGWEPGSARWAGCDDHVVGVFAGSSTSRYVLFHLLGNPLVTGAEADDWEGQLLPGAAPDYLPAQVAYRLGTTGPAIAVQTGCASSLVAVCMAAQSLLDYRCDLALAGGVSVTEPRFRFSPTGMVSPDGRCRAFDAAGQGSGYGSGVAVLALRRLADAVEAGDTSYAVLRGWAVNNDGSSRAGFAAPGLDGQAAVVAEALGSADLPADTIGYVEAHGGGTPLGDAVEVAALNLAFGDAFGDGSGPAPCLLGSIKTNLGNLDAAAGAAGLIKAVFAVRDGVVPANLHFDTPNPQIEFGRFTVPVKTTPWPAAFPVRRAGVSSFGLGGTNAHVIVEQPPAVAARDGDAAPGAVVLPLSGHTPRALRDAVLGVRSHLAAGGGDGWLLADVAYTLAGRRAFEHRLAVVAGDVAQAVAALDAEPVRGDCALHRLAADWMAGADVDWGELYAGGEHRRVWLPPYPFQRTRHWIEAP
jgi:acyl transferase domain-containing protein